MYISRLLIDVGDNPDKPRPGRTWLRNIYAVHQRLCMAFPEEKRRENDKHFLAPYKADDFQTARLVNDKNKHREESRRTTPSVLYRIDPIMEQLHGQKGVDDDKQEDFSRAMILVLSEKEPKWEHAFHNAGWDGVAEEAGILLAAKPEQKQYDPEFKQGERYRFRILMNLSQKISECKDDQGNTVNLRKPHPKGKLDNTRRPMSQGRRALLTWQKDTNPVETIRPWFEMKAGVRECKRVEGYIVEGELNTDRPFMLEEFSLVNLGWVVGYKPSRNKDGSPGLPGRNHKVQHDTLRFRSALLEGTLRVENADAFTLLALAGIGSAKAFGFGLLSLARL